MKEVMLRLDALIMVLKTCKGDLCTAPWQALHPNGKVHTLLEALKPEYDAFYRQQPSMLFYDCPRAYWAEAETQEAVVPDAQSGGLTDQTFDYTNHWHLLT